VSLQVPASWPVVNLSRHQSACPRLDVHAVYLGAAGPAPVCPAAQAGKTEAVQIQPLNPQSPDVIEAGTATVIDGQPARTNGDFAITRTINDVIPAVGTEVSLSYGGDQALARRIASTIRIRTGGSAHAAPAAPRTAVTPSGEEGLFRGAGFDACSAPSASTLSSWLTSPYRALGIYIGGANRSCGQSNLTASWIRAIRANHWHYFPIYVGPQASCVQAAGDAAINPAHARAEGRAAARDAVTQAQALSIPPGTPIIYDMEFYSGCRTEVIHFVGAWDYLLHLKGYRAGVYESFSDVADLISAAGTTTEPNVIHYADWDGDATTNSSYMPPRMWRKSERIHQYQGPHNETWAGVTMNIDNDQLNVHLGGHDGR
jgi:hypothetical protein